MPSDQSRIIEEANFAYSPLEKALENAPKCQGYNFYSFWVINGKPPGRVVTFPSLLTHIHRHTYTHTHTHTHTRTQTHTHKHAHAHTHTHIRVNILHKITTEQGKQQVEAFKDLKPNTVKLLITNVILENTLSE